LPIKSFDAEEILYYCVSILIIATFGSGFTRFFAFSFAHPRRDDGMDFNPITNLDIVGTIVFFLGGFGWGKQVDDQKIRFKKQKLGWCIISLIAPFASLTLAMSAAYIKYFLWTDRVIDVILNLSVAATAYHVLPIPPLAGSRLIYLLVPEKHERVWKLFSKAGPFIILGLVLVDRFFGIPFLREAIAPVLDGVSRFASYH
jgi:multisubunit Na+/H+ antiporter MnhG subunit